MNVKKAIAVGLLTIATITLTVLGIRFNLFNTQKTEQTNASEYITNIEISDERPSQVTSYTIYTENEATYTNATANNKYKFRYIATLEIIRPKTINGTINLSRFTYNNDSSRIETEQQTFTHTLDTQALVTFTNLEITQTSFNITENYYLTTEVLWTISYRTQTGNHTYTQTNTFEYTLNNPYETIESTQAVNLVNYDIYNNLLNIMHYGSEQYEIGIEVGTEQGQSQTAQEAYEQGKQDGYAQGYNDSEAFNHPIGIQSLMLNILTMPFTFISKAFDVTLWPNTQYAFNLANFIKGLLAVSAILFIIKVFTSGFSVFGNFNSHRSNTKPNKPNKTKDK